MLLGKAIKIVHNILFEEKLLKTTVKKVSKFLKEGTYIINKQRNLLILDNEIEHIIDLAGYFDASPLKKIRIKNTSSIDSSFSALLICEKGNKIRLFDFDNRIIKTFFSSADGLKEYLLQRNSLPHFKTCVIFNCDEEELSIEEELLSSDTNDFFNKISCLIKFYEHYYSDVAESNSQIDNLINNKNVRTSFVEKFNEYYRKNNLSFDNVPWFIQHGDLWDANLFIQNNQIKMIDFDKVGVFPFLYDLSLFIFTDSFFLKNKSIDKGMMNNLISKMFDPGFLGDKSFTDYFIFNMEVMCLTRHEIISQYSICDEIISHLNAMGFDI